MKHREARRAAVQGPQRLNNNEKFEDQLPRDAFPMLQVQTAPATHPSCLIINLVWLQEGEVKLTPFELPNYTVLREDEKAVFVQPLYWENLCQPDLQGNRGSEGPSCQLPFSGPSHRPDAFILVKGSFPGGPGEAGPPVSVPLCYEYGTDGAKSICSIGTKTLTTQLSLLKDST